MNFHISKVAENETNAIIQLYHDLIDGMLSHPARPMWEKNVYPTDAFLKEKVVVGEFYVGRCEDGIIASMICNNFCDAGYDKGAWRINADKNEVMIIHLLCVLPQYSGLGFARKMVAFAQKMARERGFKAIRLDTLAGAARAVSLYESMGFKKTGATEMYYKPGVLHKFNLFEYLV